MKCLFADLNVEFESKYEEMFQACFREYATNFEISDLAFEISKKDVDFEREIDINAKHCELDNIVSKTVVLRKIGEKLPELDGAVLHSSSFAVDGKGVAFGA